MESQESQETKKTGRGGWRGGGRPYIGRKPRSIKASDEEWQEIKKLAEEYGKDISRYVVETVLNRKENI